jgi:hypothetical protein
VTTPNETTETLFSETVGSFTVTAWTNRHGVYVQIQSGDDVHEGVVSIPVEMVSHVAALIARAGAYAAGHAHGLKLAALAARAEAAL